MRECRRRSGRHGSRRTCRQCVIRGFPTQAGSIALPLRIQTATAVEPMQVHHRRRSRPSPQQPQAALPPHDRHATDKRSRASNRPSSAPTPPLAPPSLLSPSIVGSEICESKIEASKIWQGGVALVTCMNPESFFLVY